MALQINEATRRFQGRCITGPDRGDDLSPLPGRGIFVRDEPVSMGSPPSARWVCDCYPPLSFLPFKTKKIPSGTSYNCAPNRQNDALLLNR